MKTRIYSPAEWRERWAALQAASNGRSLNEFSVLCNLMKAGWTAEGMSNTSASNGRYAVHLDDCLARGLDVPREYLATIEPERDMAYDWHSLPNLRAALREAGIIEPARWAETERRLAERQEAA